MSKRYLKIKYKMIKCVFMNKNTPLLKEIVKSIKEITIGRNKPFDKVSDIIDILIKRISQFGSYWTREVNPLNLIYKRAEFIDNFLKEYLDSCDIDWNRVDPPLNLESRRKNAIDEVLNEKLKDCGITI